MDQRVVQARRRAVTGRAGGDQPRARGQLLRRADVHLRHAAAVERAPPPSVIANSASISSKCSRTMKLMPTPVVVGFLARFGQEDHVAIERDAAALQQQHRHQVRGEHRLVVLAAAPPDVAVLHAPRRTDRPATSRAARRRRRCARGSAAGASSRCPSGARPDWRARDRARRSSSGCPRPRAPSSGSRRPASRCPAVLSICTSAR